MLEQQWCGRRPRRCYRRPHGSLHVAPASRYTYGRAAPRAATRSTRRRSRSTAPPIDPAATYRVTVNTFLADGGDGFTVLREGTTALGGGVDIDALGGLPGRNNPTDAPVAEPHQSVERL